MELLTILLAGFFSILVPGGWAIERLASNNLSSNLTTVEELAIRVENSPSYQLVFGKLGGIKLASRGVEVQPGLRIDTLEVETDSIDVKLKDLSQGNLAQLRTSLNQPLQGGVRIILTEADLNRALQSPKIQSQLQQALNGLIARKAGSSMSYQLINPRIELQDGNRLSLAVSLCRSFAHQNQIQSCVTDHDRSKSELNLKLEWGIKTVAGRKIELVEPIGTVNGRPMSARLLTGFAQGISDRLDLNTLEENGIFARLLQLEIDQEQIALAGFVRMETFDNHLSWLKLSKLD
ncbi:MAG: DUF2993 domain-containing protein [Stanieria sp.]